MIELSSDAVVAGLSAADVNCDGPVFVVDDEPGIRESLTSLLRTAGLGVEVFSSAIDALASLEEGASPACIVCDLRLPVMNGKDFLCKFREANSHTPFVILSGYGDIVLAVECMKAGAADFLEKPVCPRVLLDRIQELINIGASEWQERVRRADLAARFASLTPREKEVVEHVLAGQTSKAIAFALGISPKTVHVHRAQAGRKMMASSMAELAHLVNLARAD